MMAPGISAPSVAPSLGATLLMKTAVRPLPAPGMFLTKMMGLPGICRLRCRATVRA